MQAICLRLSLTVSLSVTTLPAIYSFFQKHEHCYLSLLSTFYQVVFSIIVI